MEKVMREKLESLSQEYVRISNEMATQEVASDPKAYARLARKHSELSGIVACFEKHQVCATELAGVEDVEVQVNRHAAGPGCAQPVQHDRAVANDVGRREARDPELGLPGQRVRLPGAKSDEQDLRRVQVGGHRSGELRVADTEQRCQRHGVEAGVDIAGRRQVRVSIEPEHR